jgi:CHAT domain-containing protein
MLISGDIGSAVEQLRTLAKNEPIVAHWNDLAAALLVGAEKLDDGNLAVDAIAAANRALTIDPSYASARFNRALALEHLGLAREARREWSRYVGMDPASAWTDEALRRLHALGTSNESKRARAAFEALKESPENVQFVVERYGEFARRVAETEVLADWGAASIAGDGTAAAQQLRLAREIGRHLVHRSGERLLFDAVAAIDRAAEHETLARAHVLYRNARRLHARNDAIAAETGLREAAQLFRRGRSPMQYMARYYLGSALHAQLRLGEATDVLDALESERLRESGYLAAAAQLGWERGACLLESGSISDAIDVFTRSSSELRRLNETDSAAGIDGLLASALDFVGDTTGGWRARRRALYALSRSGNDSRALVILQSAATTATRARQWERARALLDLTVDGATRMEHAPLAAHALTERAVVHVREKRPAFARADIARARTWLAKIGDATLRSRGEADLAFAEATVDEETEPQRALVRFDDAIEFYENAGRPVDLPRIHLERSRVARGLGRLAEARRDIDAGLAVIARERATLRDLEQRATLQSASEELFDDAVALAMEDGDPQAAFRFSEQRSARMLTELFELGADAAETEIAPLSLQQVQTALAPHAAVVAYATLPDRLVSFIVRRDRFIAATANVPRNDVTATIDSLSRAIIVDHEDVLARATNAGEMLTRNVRPALAGIRDVAFITDRYTASAPFGALRDAASGRFLIEEFSIVAAPSATLLMRASLRMHERANDAVLAIAATEFDRAARPNLQPLPEVLNEARDVAALHRNATLRAGSEATPALAATFARYGTIHFAGHAVADRDDVRESALLLAPVADDRGELRLRDITRLRLPHTRLVVLAACRSADEVSMGDGAQNLALAFTAAGVPSVIASLWNFDDRVSRILMTEVHRHLRDGASPSRAIQATAGRRLRDASGKPRFPMEWPGLVVIGGSPDLVKGGEIK